MKGLKLTYVKTIVFVTLAAVIWAVVCPAVCKASAPAVSAHACCPRAGDEKQAKDCDHDEPFTLQKQDLSFVFPSISGPLNIFIAEVEQTFAKKHTLLSLLNNHTPRPHFGVSVYLRHLVLLD